MPDRPRIAIVGSGAIGCYYGARLAQHGEDVRFLMRSDLAHVREHGLEIRSHAGDFNLPSVQVFGSTAEIGPCDLVIISLKTTANADLATLLPPLLHPGTVLITLQNGLGNEEYLSTLHPAAQVMGGVCFVCINRLSPGVISHTSDGDIALGEFTGPALPRTRTVGAMLNASGIPCRVEDSLAAVRWRKLVWNIPFNGLAIAGGGITTDVILADPALARAVRGLMDETVAAARALGHAMPDGWADFQIRRTPPMGPYRPSSMIDFVEGREVEVEAIWGEPCRQAQAAGVSTGRMEMLYWLIQSAVARRQGQAGS
ncbi:MAG: 2-dehydropantoate 2-reductase [Verrucomicrobiota bacterium]